MTRDEFEEWMEEHHEDAMSALPDVAVPMSAWLKHYASVLKKFAVGEKDTESVEPADDDFDDDLGDDEDVEDEGDE